MLDPVFEGLTYVGSFGIVWLLLAGAIAYAYRRPWLMVSVGAAVVAGESISGGLKLLLRRNRPALWDPDPVPLVDLPVTYSFPSGHATVSFACATVLAGAVPRLRVPLYVLAALIAFSRVYVGVHYPSDVIGGAALGVLIAIALRKLARALHRSAPPTQPG